MQLNFSTEQNSGKYVKKGTGLESWVATHTAKAAFVSFCATQIHNSEEPSSLRWRNLKPQL